MPNIKGALQFTNVHFSYDRGKEVLKGISLDIKPGEMIGLVGKSGTRRIACGLVLYGDAACYLCDHSDCR